MERRGMNGSTSSLQSLSSTASAEGDSVFIAPAPAFATGHEHSSDALALHRKQSLERKLLCRRSVTELAEQGIYPPLKSPAAFHEQTRHLERAKTGDILKHKIEHRPDRHALVAQNILDESATRPCLDPAIQARQRQFKKACLITDLNDRLARRPGPFDLVQTNILEPGDAVRQRLESTYTFDCDQPLDEEEDDSSFSLSMSASGQLSDMANDSNVFSNSSASNILTTQSTPPVTDRKPMVTSQSYSTSSSISPTASVSSSLTITSSQSAVSVRKVVPQQQGSASSTLKKVSTPSSRANIKPSALVTPSSGPSRGQVRQRSTLKFHIYTGPPTRRTDRVKNCSGSVQTASNTSVQSVGTPGSATPTDGGSPTHVASISTPALANYNFQRILEQQTVLLQLQNETESVPAGVTVDEDRRLLEHLDELKVTDLRRELRHRGLRMQGTKPELADRLRNVLSRGISTLSSSSSGNLNDQQLVATIPIADSPTGASPAAPSLCSSQSSGVVKSDTSCNANTNVEALMQQLQQEIEYGQVQTRRLASQPPCYVINGGQPVILVNLPNVSGQATLAPALAVSTSTGSFSQQTSVAAPTFAQNNIYIQSAVPIQSDSVPPTTQRSVSTQLPLVSNHNRMQLPLVSRQAQLSVPNSTSRSDRSALVDDVLDILIRSGELSPSAARTPKDVLSSPGTADIINSIARRNELHNSAMANGSSRALAAANDSGAVNAAATMNVDGGKTNASCHFRFSLPPDPNAVDAMEYTPAPSPLPSVHMDDCTSLFAPTSVHSGFTSNVSLDTSAADLSEELLSLMATSGGSNCTGQLQTNVNLNMNLVGPMHDQMQQAQPTVVWTGDSEQFLLGSATASQTQMHAAGWYCGSANGDIDLNSLMYAPAVAYRGVPNESNASPQSSVCDMVNCNR